MRRDTSRAVALAFTLAGAAALVGCGSSSNGGAPDAGGGSPDGSTALDASTGDASSDGGASDAGSGGECGAIAPSGEQVVATTTPLVLQGYGVTSDGYAFYEDTNAQVLYAVPAAGGGAPASLGTVTSQSGTFYLNGGKAVLFLPSAASPTTSVAPLSAWSAANGTKVISSSAFAADSYDYTYDVTKDGTYVAYFLSAGGSTVTLMVSTIDGTTQTPLVHDIDLTSESCQPIVQWVGDTLVAYYCLAASATDAGGSGDAGGAGDLTIAAFAQQTSFAQVVLATFPPPSGNRYGGIYSPQRASADGTELLVACDGLALYPLDGSPPTTIDAAGVAGGFTPSGDVIYTTDATELLLWSRGDAGADGGTSTQLVLGGAFELLALSPDGNWLQVAKHQDAPTGLTDLYLASATTPGALTSLWSPTTADAFGFTADSKYETFGTDFPAAFGSSSFDLEASPVTGGTATKIITSAGGFTFTTASKVVVNTNPNALTGSADIVSVDLSAPASPTTLVTQADPDYFYVSGTNKILYSWHCEDNASSGIWSVSAP